MEAQIAIPDLEDDTIYSVEGPQTEVALKTASQADSSSQHRPRPFRGAELEHSRSGSVVSLESSTGSKQGGFGGHFGGRGPLGSQNNGSNSGIASTPNPPAFPRKGSFASLKAAFKAPPAPSGQDAYPPQLRNPFANGGDGNNANGISGKGAVMEAGRAHGRNDSHVGSNTSRQRGLPSSISQRHVHQISLHSDHSMAASTSMSESTTGTGSGFRTGPPLPPMPPFPEAYSSGNTASPSSYFANSSSLPPARTAYARSMSAQAGIMSNGGVGSNGEDALPSMSRMYGGGHDRTNSAQSSSIEPHPHQQYQHQQQNSDSAPSWMQDTMTTYETEGPLQPPQPGFANAWHKRGSSGGSREVSEDGTRPSLDQGHPSRYGGSQTRVHGGSSSHGMPPIRYDRNGQRQGFLMGENASVASLPAGIGLDEPASPAEYAINVLCSRFITLAGVRIRTATGGVDESDPSLEKTLGQGADTALDTLLDSLAHISRKNPAPVIRSLFQWRDNMGEERIDVGDVRGALSGSQTGVTMGVRDVANVLTRRKILATSYLLSRTLIQVCNTLAPGASENSIRGLSDAQATELLGKSFDLMRECSRERWPTSRMQADAFDNASRILGVISKVCFAAVGDRFVAFFEQCSLANPNAKESDVPSEVAVAAIRHLSITSYPMELFEEGAEFLEIMARNFAAAHGQKLKSTYAESLTCLLLPVAESASAELHHPTWVKALDSISPRAFAMLSKPRYWPVAYPLYVAVLCVSPEDRVLQSAQAWSWIQCMEAGVAKLGKDRSNRTAVLNAAVFLLWTYLFRCKESSSTTTKRLESYFRVWFPPHRPHIFPSDSVVLDWHIYMTHYVLYRQFEFGRDIVLEFLRAQALSGNTLSLQPELLSRQRMTIAIRAILLTLDAHVKETSPPFPAEANFSIEKTDLGDELPDTFKFPTPDIGTAQLHFNDLIGKIALLCNHQVGSVSIFDDQVALWRGTSVSQAMASVKGTSEEEKLCWRLHPSHRLVAAYNKEHQPYMDLLRACVDSWPRCLSANIPFSNVLSVLHRAFFSADPMLADAAVRCHVRIAEQRKGGAMAIVSSFMRWILRVDAVYWETHPSQHLVLTKVEQAVKMLSNLLSIWTSELRKSQAASTGRKGWEMERTSAWAVIDEVEAIGLFLLCSAWRPLRRHAISILRIVSTLDDVFSGKPTEKPSEQGEEANDADKENEATRIIHLLVLPCGRFMQSMDDANSGNAAEQTAWQQSRSKRWRRAPSSKETLAELAESDKSNELTTWFLIVPHFLRTCLEHFPTTVAVFRSVVTKRIIAMESAVSAAAGTSNRAPAVGTTSSTLKGQAVGAAGALMPFTIGNSAGASSAAATAAASGALTPEQNLMAEHWRMYILALCTTTTSIEGSAHRMKAVEGSSMERGIAAKDLFQKLVPYLASDHARFREAVVTAMGNINSNLYRTLLETLQTVNAQLSEDFKRSSSKRNRQHERLRTALAHVIQLTSTHMTREGTLTDSHTTYLILQWIKETFAFLTDREVRLDWDLHRLRRFYAGVVEEFFDALYKPNRSIDDAIEDLLPYEARLRMFRLFRDWHSFSQAAKDGPAKLANLLASVAEQHREDRNREAILTALRNETQSLSFHASSAMAALCQGVIAVAEGRNVSGNSLALEPGLLIEWLKHLFLSPSPQNHSVARRALKALLMHNIDNAALMKLTLEHSFAEPEQTTATRSFFAVFAEVIVEKRAQANPTISVPQILCLGLVKLGHPDIDTRKRSFVLLSSITPSSIDQTLSPLHAMEGGVSSPLPATYLRAQRDVSTRLADVFQEHKVAMLSECALRLQEIDLSRRATTLGLLPEWLQGISYAAETEQDGTGVGLSRRAMLILSNLLAMTIRYGDEHNFEIQDMWASLAEGDNYAVNARVIVKYLIQQALALRTSAFIMHAKRAVSCLSHTVLASALFVEMCSYIEPSSMIPVPLESDRLASSDPRLDHLYLANIEDHLPPPSRRQTFSPGQVALLFVGELTYERTNVLLDNLPLLLHAIFMHVDSTSAFTQEQVMTMFEQLMRSINAAEGGPNHVNAQAERLFGKGTSIFWTQDEADFDASHTPRVMRNTVSDTVALIAQHVENVNDRWGNVALHWATSNPVRHMACRSFQMFRILMPEVNYSMLADMLGRLSNTISDSVRLDNQSFALEILYTMKAVVRTIDSSGGALPVAKQELLGHIFWMNVACLSTVNESEFGQAVGLMHIVLEKLDLDAEHVVDTIKKQCPDGWEGELGGLQMLVVRGLKSNVVYKDSFRLLVRISKIFNDQLIDGHNSRVGYVFIVSLPWFLQASDDPGTVDDLMLSALAEDIGKLAAKEGKVDVERVATSISKKRFRTKDDLLRQAVSSCVRSGFLPNHATGVALTLMAITFNAEAWLRKQTLQVLKIFFQAIDLRKQNFSDLGPELLMPLLRLLSTDLSMEVLEVLEEKILSTAQGTSNPQRRGPNAQQIIRMSLQWHNQPSIFAARRVRGQGPDGPHRHGRIAAGGNGGAWPQEDRWHASNTSDLASSHATHESNSLFGMPGESGWSVADIPDWTSRTRINILSVFKNVELLLDTPPVGEVNFVDDYDAEGDNVFEANMTASRLEAEDVESASASASLQHRSASGRARSGGLSGTAATLPEQASFSSQQSIDSRGRRRATKGEEDVDEKVNVGDIISQLHDLSSFFIDDDLEASNQAVGAGRDGLASGQGARSGKQSRYGRRKDNSSSTSTRLTHFWGTSNSSHGGRNESIGEESGEQVAKILSRSALANMMGRTAGVVTAAARSASLGTDSTSDVDRQPKTPTPGALHESVSGEGLSSPTSLTKGLPPSTSFSSGGGTTDDGTSSIGKRGSMWGRKSLFGRRPTPQPTRSATEFVSEPLPSDSRDFSFPTSLASAAKSSTSADSDHDETLSTAAAPTGHAE